MTKIEPINFKPEFKNYGFSQDGWPLLATKTLRINLKFSLEKIYSQFKKDCRYILKRIQKNNYKTTFNNFDNFYEIWKLSSQRKGIWIPSKKEFDDLIKIFEKKCFCITVSGRSGALIIIYQKTAYYYYAGATKEGNRENLPYLIIWEALREAKKRKCSVFDFEGIYDSRWPNKNWQGFSHFKKSFGGYEVEFPGSFTRWFY